MSGLNNREVFPHSSGGFKFKVKVSVGLISSKVSFLDLEMAVFSPSLQLVWLCACVLHKDSSHIGLGLCPVTSFQLN